MEPTTPTPDVAPAAPIDPFAAFTQPTATPVAPAEPTATPTAQPIAPTEVAQPTAQPTEVAQPVAQPTADPVAPPTAPPVAPPADDFKTFDEYMEEALKGVPTAPEQPDASSINPDDPAAIKGFFDDLMSTAEQRFEAKYAKNEAIKNAENTAWNQAFEKYGTLKSNKAIRDMVQNIRMGYFQKGIAVTPTQAADKLLEAFGQQYKQGVADNQVVSKIESVQPQGGGTVAIPTTLDRENVLTSVQNGGEAALANFLDAQIKDGKL